MERIDLNAVEAFLLPSDVLVKNGWSRRLFRIGHEVCIKVVTYERNMIEVETVAFKFTAHVKEFGYASHFILHGDRRSRSRRMKVKQVMCNHGSNI